MDTLTSDLNHSSGKAGLIESYVHSDGEVGVLLQVTCETKATSRQQAFKSLCRDLALQIAASGPQYISRDDAPGDFGPSVARWNATVCLLEQPFVKDPEKTVLQVLEEEASKLGEKIEVLRFTRYQI